MEFTKKEIKGIKEHLKVCANGRMDSLTFIHNGEDYSLSYEFSGLGEVSVCIAKYDYENEDEGLNILFDERFSYDLYDENDEKKTDDEIIDFTKNAFDSIGIDSVEVLVWKQTKHLKRLIENFVGGLLGNAQRMALCDYGILKR